MRACVFFHFSSQLLCFRALENILEVSLLPLLTLHHWSREADLFTICICRWSEWLPGNALCVAVALGVA